MVDVVVPTHVSGIAVAEPAHSAAALGSSAEIDASINAYLGAGDGMATIMKLTMWACGALIVLIAIAWAFGALPGAVRLF
jgi:hypothetical protein